MAATASLRSPRAEDRGLHLPVHHLAWCRKCQYCRVDRPRLSLRL